METQKKRRVQVVKKACQLCRKGHRACDDQRPCSRCFKKGLECIDDEDPTTPTTPKINPSAGNVKTSRAMKPMQSQIPLTQLLQQHQQQAFPSQHYHTHFHNGSSQGSIGINSPQNYPSSLLLKPEAEKNNVKGNNIPNRISVNTNGGLIHLNPINPTAAFSNSNNSMWNTDPYSIDPTTTTSSLDAILMNSTNNSTNNTNNTISLPTENDPSFSSVWMQQQVYEQNETQNDLSKNISSNVTKVENFEGGIDSNEVTQTPSLISDSYNDVSVFFNSSQLMLPNNGNQYTTTSSSSSQNSTFTNAPNVVFPPGVKSPMLTLNSQSNSSSPFSPIQNQTSNSNQFPKNFSNGPQNFGNSNDYSNTSYLTSILFGTTKENSNQFYNNNNNNNNNNQQQQALQAQVHELKDMVNTQGQVISRLLNYIKSYHSLESGVHLPNENVKFNNINFAEFFKKFPASRDFQSSLSMSSSLSFPVPLSPTDEMFKRIAQSMWDLNSLRILGCNQSFCDLTGYTMEEFATNGFLCTQLVPDRLVQNTVLLMLKLSAGSAKYVEAKTMVKTKTGTETCCLLKARVSLDLQQLYVQHVFIEYCDDEYRIDDLIHFASFKTKQCCRMLSLPAPTEENAKKASCCCATTPTPSCCDLHFTLNAMG
eukprot:TRINITY_DN5031_c0_g4_i1.p1 TRINITY_DN5031_c0_g4~~TRINITY_DN5031_c0_g4_i1.p1  ORF type:complete len:649 (-),score=159.11 TRINITY_DN5031_c0_g4_i1:132-2078(-)